MSLAVPRQMKVTRSLPLSSLGVSLAIRLVGVSRYSVSSTYRYTADACLPRRALALHRHVNASSGQLDYP